MRRYEKSAALPYPMLALCTNVRAKSKLDLAPCLPHSAADICHNVCHAVNFFSLFFTAALVKPFTHAF